MQGDAQAVLDVAAGLFQTLAEIVVPGRINPRVMLRPAVQPRLVNVRGKQLGQRRTGRLLPAGPAGEVDVGIHRKAHARQHQFLRQQHLAVQPHGLAEAQPGLDTALAARLTIVVDDALNPLAAGVAVRAVGENGRVLHRNADLIVETVRHPTLNLLAGCAAVVHGNVERVMNVVVATLVAQGLLEFGNTHRLALHGGLLTERSAYRHGRPRCHAPPVRRARQSPRPGSDWCC